MNLRFVKEYLTNVKWKKNKDWQIKGNIKKISNQYYKFDIRFLKDFSGKEGKLINSESQADKILFEDDKNWILIDTKELIKYMREHSLKEVKLKELIDNIDWSILLPKK
jgi:hypothetical protein